MEEAPASVYQALLEFQHLSRSTVAAIVSTHVPNALTWQTVLANCLEVLPVSLPLSFVEKMLQESDRGSQEYCYSCHMNHPYGFDSECPHNAGVISKVSTMPDANIAMEKDIKDALAKVSSKHTVMTRLVYKELHQLPLNLQAQARSQNTASAHARDWKKGNKGCR
ncbi:uncharacterized protein PHACADRAFT_33549 [Phanerochaete carnosa HHB-10118-sp]|uniref:Uncharacterized protein n=1 Tax=Phanerochaete carnosa (strain HHB-10118-sp) TaxID=650164 RepID=K5VR97_PHACS|nr:uncharacterized protein PHACADRAFT_33549 [Phanerochaete carnosa HHB-10118-sp]EKM49260.1 hypothetical protein PHACADRAFT_33549 [Phanerochaete carnosa HHB-10118-sp]